MKASIVLFCVSAVLSTNLTVLAQPFKIPKPREVVDPGFGLMKSADDPCMYGYSLGSVLRFLPEKQLEIVTSPGNKATYTESLVGATGTQKNGCLPIDPKTAAGNDAVRDAAEWLNEAIDKMRNANSTKSSDPASVSTPQKGTTAPSKDTKPRNSQKVSPPNSSGEGTSSGSSASRDLERQLNELGRRGVTIGEPGSQITGHVIVVESRVSLPGGSSGLDERKIPRMMW